MITLRNHTKSGFAAGAPTMKGRTALAIGYGVVPLPLHTNAIPSAPVSMLSLLEAAETAVGSGHRARRTATITTGRFLGADRKRSAIALADSGLAACAGAFFRRGLPCRNQNRNNIVGGLEIPDYSTRPDADGNRTGWGASRKAPGSRQVVTR